jgi:hypothetical protein
MLDDGPWFLVFFVGVGVLRIVFAHLVYGWLLSEAPECPCCGAETLRMERRNIAWLFPRLRPSWCPECSWDGMLRPSRDTTPVRTERDRAPVGSASSSLRPCSAPVVAATPRGRPST